MKNEIKIEIRYGCTICGETRHAEKVKLLGSYAAVLCITHLNNITKPLMAFARAHQYLQDLAAHHAYIHAGDAPMTVQHMATAQRAEVKLHEYVDNLIFLMREGNDETGN